MKALPIMKALLITLGIIIVFFAASTYAQVTIKHVALSEQQATLTNGEELFDELCVACHGMGGIGNGPAVSALKKAPSNLTVLAVNNNGTFPRTDVRKAIAGRFREDPHGSIGMPSWRQAFASANPDQRMYRRQIFAMQQVDRLTDYLETIQTR
ncbi:MAG: cytochrome c [Pseudomonadota bacterium]